MSAPAIMLWALWGLLLGAAHGALLHGAAARPRAASGLARLCVVGGGLVAAAALGGLLPAAAGWAAGYAVVVACTATRPSRHGGGPA